MAWRKLSQDHDNVAWGLVGSTDCCSMIFFCWFPIAANSVAGFQVNRRQACIMDCRRALAGLS
jgi:hypothetical protein